jgi:predicted DNA-binding transcriptional regulator YafY
MRASRLLQNRGRLTAPALARELEVDPRTILRDVDAMSQAGLPILTHRGAMGGIELGFNYRTRLTGLAEDEAEALAIWLAAPPAVIAGAIRAGLTLRLRARLPKPVALKPTSLIHGPQGWSVFGPPLTTPVPQTDWGDINLSRAPL